MGQQGEEGISGRVWVEMAVGVCWDGPEMDESMRKGRMEELGHGEMSVCWDGPVMDESTRKGWMEGCERRWRGGCELGWMSDG